MLLDGRKHGPSLFSQLGISGQTVKDENRLDRFWSDLRPPILDVVETRRKAGLFDDVLREVSILPGEITLRV